MPSGRLARLLLSTLCKASSRARHPPHQRVSIPGNGLTTHFFLHNRPFVQQSSSFGTLIAFNSLLEDEKNHQEGTMPRLEGKQSNAGMYVIGLIIALLILFLALEYFGVINLIAGFGSV
jgi:hypothetical protein